MKLYLPTICIIFSLFALCVFFTSVVGIGSVASTGAGASSKGIFASITISSIWGSQTPAGTE